MGEWNSNLHLLVFTLILCMVEMLKGVTVVCSANSWWILDLCWEIDQFLKMCVNRPIWIFCGLFFCNNFHLYIRKYFKKRNRVYFKKNQNKLLGNKISYFGRAYMPIIPGEPGFSFAVFGLSVFFLSENVQYKLYV